MTVIEEPRTTSSIETPEKMEISPRPRAFCPFRNAPCIPSCVAYLYAINSENREAFCALIDPAVKQLEESLKFYQLISYARMPMPGESD